MRKEIWYSYKGSRYHGNGSVYYNLDGIDWYEQLKSNLANIQQETLSLLERGALDIKPYFNNSMVEGTKWEAVSFMLWKERNEAAIVMGAPVVAYFKDIRGLVSLSISILQPKTRIKGHHGDTDATYRIHIPIYIPSQVVDECGLKVSGSVRAWYENEILVFNDACFHEAWNMTGRQRVVLIMDVVKEDFIDMSEDICSRVLASMKYQRLLLKHKIAKKIPGWLRNTIIKLMSLT